MCGLFGIIKGKGITPQWYDNAVKELAILNMLRGYDSTGLIVLPERGKQVRAETIKRAVNAATFVELPRANDAISYSGATQMGGVIGHCRWATRGQVNLDNAHPFQHGGVTMVHNGTIDNPRELVAGHNFAFFDTDSEHICYALSQAEPDAYKTVLEKILGPFVIAWHDARNGMTRVARNESSTNVVREFHFAPSAKHPLLFMSSEWMALSLIEERNPNVAFKDIYVMEPGTVLSWKDDPRDFQLERFTMRKMPKPPAAVPPKYAKGTGAGSGNVKQVLITDDEYIRTSGLAPVGSRITWAATSLALPKEKSRHGLLRGYLLTSDAMPNLKHTCVKAYSQKLILAETTLVKEAVVVGYVQEKRSIGTDHVMIVMDVKDTDVTSLRGRPFISIDSTENYSAPTKGAPPEPVGTDAVTELNDPWPEDVTEAANIDGPNGRKITLTEFSKLTKDGCAWCQCDLFPTDEVHYTDRDEPLCPSCNRVWTNEQYLQ